MGFEGRKSANRANTSANAVSPRASDVAGEDSHACLGTGQTNWRGGQRRPSNQDLPPPVMSKSEQMACKFCGAKVRKSHLFRRRTGNAGNFFPFSIYGGREFIHLLKEHRDLPDLLVFQCGSETRHRGEADSMLYRPERCGFGIIFDPSLANCGASI
jgi:hypothetical protein